MPSSVPGIRTSQHDEVEMMWDSEKRLDFRAGQDVDLNACFCHVLVVQPWINHLAGLFIC